MQLATRMRVANIRAGSNECLKNASGAESRETPYTETFSKNLIKPAQF
jgi:hypothetical protein